ncbi:hypothetical protein, partial [Modicisalibacter coralii]|uniref:hypothetical protein n=1 Tax=Modicisalibacter coralii TaxID=2304602 RepID=UPI001396CACC
GEHAELVSHDVQLAHNGYLPEQRRVTPVRRPDLLMRWFLPNWYWACLIDDDYGGGAMHSLQIFDRTGRSVHRLVIADIDNRGWRQLEAATDARHPRANPARATRPVASRRRAASRSRRRSSARRPGAERLLRRYRLSRLTANRLLAGHGAERLSVDAFVAVLERPLRRRVTLELEGCTHVQSGWMTPWSARGDPSLVLGGGQLRLTIDTTALSEAWCVTRPGADGRLETGFEAFDGQGRLVASVG